MLVLGEAAIEVLMIAAIVAAASCLGYLVWATIMERRLLRQRRTVPATPSVPLELPLPAARPVTASAAGRRPRPAPPAALPTARR